MTNKFAQNHPIMSGVANMAGDVVGFGLGNTIKVGNKFLKELTENNV
mgnify:CR=1 FL=1